MKQLVHALFKTALLAGLLLPAGFFSACQRNADPTPVHMQPDGKRLKRITWADTDFQEFSYNAGGLLTQYVSQWLLVMGTDQVKRVETAFDYNARQQVVRSVTNGRLETKYFYRGNRLERSEEYDHQGRLAITHYYNFNAGQQPLEIRDVITDPTEGNRVTGELKRVFEYDGRGNNTVQKEYVKNLVTGVFELDYSLHFEGFDRNRYVENAVALTPFVPHARLWTNNYASRTLRDQDGNVLQPSQTYTFGCDEGGYPVRKRMGNSGGAITATVAYE